jgi:hypothetical protein
MDVDKAKFAELFQNRPNLTFSAALSLELVSKVQCHNFAVSVNAHIDRRTLGGGLRGIKTAASHTGKAMPISAHLTRVSSDAPVGHLLTYKANLGGSTGDATLDGPIFALKQNLDRGLLVLAHVLSGLKQEKPSRDDDDPQLEHYVLILGYELTSYGSKFVFWDPDRKTSSRNEVTTIARDDNNVLITGFGLLHFVAARAVGTHPPSPTAGVPERFATSGRFSTEAVHGGILVNGDGDHMDAFGMFGNVSGEAADQKQHRYQVGELEALETGGA